MNVIYKFVWAFFLFVYPKEIFMVFFRYITPLPIAILQISFREIDNEYNFFSQLSVYRDPVGAGLFNNFAFTKLLEPEPDLICIGENKLAFEPLMYLFVTFANDTRSLLVFSLLITCFKPNLECACFCRVIVALDLNVFSLDTLKLLSVKRNVIS